MSDKRQARLAFIGCGNFATANIFPNIATIPEIDLVAVCDLDRKKAERNARNFGARSVYTDMEEMLDKEELDGVFVIGPAPQQYKLAPHVLRRGIPVYVEKPSANTSTEAKELAELAEANGVWGQVGFMKRFAYVYTMAKEIIEGEDFGPLHMVKAKFAQGPYPQIWGIDSPKRSMLIGQLCHVFDLVQYFAGPAKRVNAFYREVTPTQFAYSVNVEYEGGKIGQLDLNGLESQTGFRDITERLELVGLGTNVVCNNMLTLDWQGREDFVKSVPRTGRYLHSYEPTFTGLGNSRQLLGYHGEVAHFAKRCIGTVTDGPDLWDSYRSLLLGEAIYDSAETGRTVDIIQGDR